MTPLKSTLIIPVENQVRELDPKLLLACVAASRGYPCIIGSRRDVELDIDLYPRGIFLSKSMTIRSLLMFHVTRVLGHEVVTWDEEALVHLPADQYYDRRMHPLAMRYISHLFAWGEDNAELWRRYPHMPKDVPIHVTGNPRSDLLRPDVRRYYQSDADALRKEHGDFILVNTNFNHVNAFFAKLNVFVPSSKPGKSPQFARGARGMTREFAQALHEHKQSLFESFQEMIPALAAAFPDRRIVVRPHPTEKHDVYHAIAARCPNVKVTNVGNVVPWLMATKALVHNGCTTGVEAYALGVPTISYRPRIDERIDDGFYYLPNALSIQCFTLEKVIDTLRGVLRGAPPAIDEAARRALFHECLAGLEGETASARIVDVLDGIGPERLVPREPGPWGRFQREVVRFGLKVVRRYRAKLPGEQNSPEFQRHRYPGTRLDELRERVARWQAVLGATVPLQVEQLAEHIFRIAC
jgi:surface carbohydrate biosynthesis protein